MPRILIVEDEHVLARNLQEKLCANGYSVAVAHTGRDALAACATLLPDVILLDVRLPDTDGIVLLPKLKAEASATNVIVMTAHGNERIAVDAMKAGAFEYLTKPVDLDELALTVQRAVEHQQMADNLRFLRQKEAGSSGLDLIIGSSESTRLHKESIHRLTRTEAFGLPDAPTVLITGETGTGKDLAARALHYGGPRKDKPFIHVNCTALPPTLFESELFGHLRGSFTSASHAKRGLFEVAHGGTIFLDEIGHLDMAMQAKLLQAIESREIRPVGATETRTINVHVIAATNRDLRAAVESGEFRRDLYHRLRVIELHVDALRDRREDIQSLVQHFLVMHCARFGMKPKSMNREAMNALLSHDWPGNVRELSHLIESTVLQVDCDEIQPRDLRLGETVASTGDLRIDVVGGQSIVIDFDRGEPKLDEIEHTILVAAFEHTGRNLSRAARILGITREALRYRLNRMTEAAREDA
ncbi:MAG: sigma-54 dependent transcriptional regulator [Planctomycetota bacterium]